MNPNKDIILYTDYRKFLNDYYDHYKKTIPGFSYRLLAEKAGFSSASFWKLVVDGKKNLSKESVLKISKALRLNKKSTDYFESIVFFTQAKDLETREYFLDKIDAYRKRNKPELILEKSYDYLKNWINVLLRQVVDMPSFIEDPEKIASMIPFDVKPSDIKQSLNFLLEHGFIYRNEEGRLCKKDKTLSTGDLQDNPRLSMIARKYHLQMIDNAKVAIAELPATERSVTNTTLSMSKETYDKALKRIESLRYELLEMASSDEKAVDQLFQLNINVFPLIKNLDAS